ncbi:MAG: Eco57I restriction-modification methylase domain-containing protein [Azoarcus sp.]|jgi:site-specific DNA-methyltransferase (adenine-specific)|nr:Eco57I restriction-modification methylase domain-containing protein [Azoarcus sp.]
MADASYNPDVLSCLANLSNDEVFTPPAIVNAMLDMLPQELFSNPNSTFLDPVTKSGVFLREMAKRLIKGLENEIPDLQDRVNHIFHKQLYGIAITELTSLLSRRSVYCSKYPNGRYSVTPFDDVSGNVRFKAIFHTWKNGKCVFCGASEKEYRRDESLETHAYEFIHTLHPERIFNMKFDVIIGNPPYQLSDGGAQASAIPIYQQFVEQSKKLQPRYLTMIIPARWYSGGRGLDEFRNNMIKDERIRILHDYLNSVECFGSGVEIKGGICFFLWNRDNNGLCDIFTHCENKIKLSCRKLKEMGSDVFIRHVEGVYIYNKVQKFKELSFSSLVSSQKPFGLRTFVKGNKSPFHNSVKIYERGGSGYIDKNSIENHLDWVDEWKILISRAYNAGDNYPHQIIGKPILSEPGSACTETYIVIGTFPSENIVRNVIGYIETRFFRFMVYLKKISQMASQTVYSFVPMQDFSEPWTDAKLYAKYGLTEEEIAFIESMIRPMDLSSGDDNA